MPDTMAGDSGNDTIISTDSGNDTLDAGVGGDTTMGVDLPNLDPGGSAPIPAEDPILSGPGDQVLPHVDNQDPPPVPPAPPAMQTAGVGRIVHYYDNSVTGPYAALVTGIVPGAGLQLTVFRPGSFANYVAAIPYVDDLRADGPAWRWPSGLPGSDLPLANVNATDIQTMFPGATGDLAFGVRKDRGH